MKASVLILLTVSGLVSGLVGCASTHPALAMADAKAVKPGLPAVALGPETKPPPPESAPFPQRDDWWSSPRMQLAKPAPSVAVQ